MMVVLSRCESGDGTNTGPKRGLRRIRYGCRRRILRQLGHKRDSPPKQFSLHRRGGPVAIQPPHYSSFQPWRKGVLSVECDG